MKRIALTMVAALAVNLPACTGDSAVGGDPSGPSLDVVPLGSYVLEVQMDAEARYTADYAWMISKEVNPAFHEGYAGESFTSTYTIAVDRTVTESKFEVTGTITITNPNDYNVEFDIGEIESVSCDAYTVLANGYVTCTYSKTLTDKTNGTVTVKVTGTDSEGIGFEINPSADYTFGEASNPTGPLSVYVSDTHMDQSLGQVSEDWTYQYERTFTCSLDGAAYTNGVYEDTDQNTATIAPVDQQLATIESTDWSAQASVSLKCSAGFTDLLKLTGGAVNPQMDWTFNLYEGPDGFGNTPVGSSTTLGATDGVLGFGGPALNADKTYTVCELSVPAGWSSVWQVNGTIINPYNPDAQDVGNRCVDFGANSTMPITVGETLRFSVDNTQPGGDARSAGYWKNWNACTAGGQAANAERNGGYANGFWLIGDVLDPAIGGGIVWDDIRSDALRVEIGTCQQAVEILEQRVVTDNNRVADGKKLANDAARTLSMQLLAAQLNLGAGACTTQEVLDAVLAAETLLDKIDFDGTKSSAYLTSKSGADYREAVRLAGVLNTYNNGGFCGSTK